MNANLARALELAASGRAAEALAIVDPAAAAGDADALLALGLWRLEGVHLPRDLGEARRCVEAAEAQGLMLAARALSAFLANGIGGPPDWPAAVALLHRWRDRDQVAARQLELLAAMRLDEAGDPGDSFTGEVLCEAPAMRRFAGLFSPDEAAFLREVSSSRFKPALAYDEQAQRFVRHPFRDATVAAFPAVLEWPAIHALNRRIAAASGTDVAQGEPLQVLRYAPGQQYRAHLDAVPGLTNQRVWTMLVALNEDFEGGATTFPEPGIAFRGRIGDALLFRNVGPDGRPDRSSLHAGAPVEIGVKLIASRWIREHRPPSGEAFGRHETLPSTGQLSQ
jgi:prolyl 4-hydroxylase